MPNMSQLEKTQHSECTLEGCQKKPRSKYADLCAMHYHRKYRHGSPGEAAARKRDGRNEFCCVPGCMNADRYVGYCAKHDARMRRHGDPHKVVAPKDRNMPTGVDHPNWVGNHAGYTTSHSRVARERGKAELHQCVDCGTKASHWSYGHDAPDEKVESMDGLRVAFSPTADYYSPRCVPCHKRFDLGRLDAAWAFNKQA